MITVQLHNPHDGWGPPSIDYDIEMSLAEYTALRARVAEVWPTLSDLGDGKMLGATASAVGSLLAAELGLIEPGQWNDMRKVAKAWMPGDPIASSSFLRVLTNRARVIAVDGVPLKRRKHFPRLSHPLML